MRKLFHPNQIYPRSLRSIPWAVPEMRRNCSTNQIPGNDRDFAERGQNLARSGGVPQWMDPTQVWDPPPPPPTPAQIPNMRGNLWEAINQFSFVKISENVACKMTTFVSKLPSDNCGNSHMARWKESYVWKLLSRNLRHLFLIISNIKWDSIITTNRGDTSE